MMTATETMQRRLAQLVEERELRQRYAPTHYSQLDAARDVEEEALRAVLDKVPA